MINTTKLRKEIKKYFGADGYKFILSKDGLMITIKSLPLYTSNQPFIVYNVIEDIKSKAQKYIYSLSKEDIEVEVKIKDKSIECQYNKFINYPEFYTEQYNFWLDTFVKNYIGLNINQVSKLERTQILFKHNFIFCVNNNVIVYIYDKTNNTIINKKFNPIKLDYLRVEKGNKTGFLSDIFMIKNDPKFYQYNEEDLLYIYE